MKKKIKKNNKKKKKVKLAKAKLSQITVRFELPDTEYSWHDLIEELYDLPNASDFCWGDPEWLEFEVNTAAEIKTAERNLNKFIKDNISKVDN